jgi:hypothetical protein
MSGARVAETASGTLPMPERASTCFYPNNQVIASRFLWISSLEKWCFFGFVIMTGVTILILMLILYGLKERQRRRSGVVFGLVAWRATNVPYHRWNVDSYMLFSH